MAFEGLSEADVARVYDAGKLKNFKKDEPIVKEGEEGNMIFFIVYGVVNVTKSVRGQKRLLATLGSGDFIGEISFVKSVKRTASVTADVPTTCLCLDERGMNTLPPKIQLTIFKNLNAVISARIDMSFDKEAKHHTQTHRLVNYIVSDYYEKTKDYETSEFLLSAIEKLPRLPDYTIKLTNMFFDDKAFTNDIVKVVEKDPLLVGLVLKMANSSHYNLNCKVADFSHALLFLGFDHIYQILLDIGVRKMMPKKRYCQELYSHSSVVSFISYEIAMITNMPAPVLLSALGILHDIGKFIAFMLRISFPKLKALIGGLYHAKLGEIVLKQWNIPEKVYGTVRYQDYCHFATVDEVPAEYVKNVAVLHIAHICYDYLKNNDDSGLYGVFSQSYFETLETNDKSIIDFLTKRLLPTMARKIDTYPEDIRFMIKDFRTDVD